MDAKLREPVLKHSVSSLSSINGYDAVNDKKNQSYSSIWPVSSVLNLLFSIILSCRYYWVLMIL